MTEKKYPLDRTAIIEEEMPKTEQAPPLVPRGPERVAAQTSLSGTVVMRPEPSTGAEAAAGTVILNDDDEIRAARALLRARRRPAPLTSEALPDGPPSAAPAVAAPMSMGAPFAIAKPVADREREPSTLPPWQEALRDVRPADDHLMQTLVTPSARPYEAPRAEVAVAEAPAPAVVVEAPRAVAPPTPTTEARAAAPREVDEVKPQEPVFGRNLPPEPEQDVQRTAPAPRPTVRVAERKEVGRGLYSQFGKKR